jgi:type II secretory pathway pseudopilin PulG
MKKTLRKKYEAVGFVEALIAIMVVGISAVVLMQIAVNTMKKTIQNEVIDFMTQYAVEASEMVQDIANRDRDDEQELFPPSDVWGSCFTIQKSENTSNFIRNPNNPSAFVMYDRTDRATFTIEDYATIEEDDTYFRIVCIDSNTTAETPAFAIVRIVIGQRVSDGEVTEGNLVKDYEYLTVVKL